MNNTWRQTAPGAWQQELEFPLSTSLHVPGEDGRLWDSTVPKQTVWSPAIPRANFIITEESGRWTLLTPFEARPAFYSWKLLRKNDHHLLEWTLRLAPTVTDRASAASPQWHALPCGTREEAIEKYRTFMQRSFPQPKRYRPEWCQRIPGCAMIQLWAGTGEIDHTFEELTELLFAMRAAGVPGGTLVYFWGWFAPFDRLYPEYWPAAELGGEQGLRRVLATARRFGYRLLPHTNHHGFNEDSPGFAEFAPEQVVDIHGTKLGWRERGEPAIEYMRPSSAKWRTYHVEKLKHFVDAFPVDGLFWDQYGVLFEDPVCDYFTHAHCFANELQAALPQTVLSSELLNERIYDMPLWMHWGTPWCGLPVREEMPHTDLLGKLFQPLLAATFGHQGTPAAVPVPHTWPSYYWYIEHYGQQEAVRRSHAWHQSVGAVPSVRLNFREYGLDPTAQAILTGTF